MGGVEWTGAQQLTLLVKSGGIGFALGLLFGVWEMLEMAFFREKRKCFVADALFFLPAALITFFGLLALADGRMHPLLFAGILIGFLAERAGVDRHWRRLLALPGRLVNGWRKRSARRPRRKERKHLGKTTKKSAKNFAILRKNT